jgi:ketosteroid isomerase-like protein
MTSKTTHEADEAQIRMLLQQWAHATRHGENDEVLSNHVSDALIFDVLPPLKYEGTDAYRRSWDQWQPSFEMPSLFEIHELGITAGQDVAFSHFLIQCGGTLPNGKKIEDWVRATVCFRKAQGQWKVTHQHISMPMRMNGSGS